MMPPAEREAIRPKRSSSRGYDYAHMCRDEHVQIGHNDDSSELCPLCREKNRADDAVAEVASLQGLLERQQEVIQTVIDALEFELLTPRDIWASHVMQAIDELRGAIPPSPQNS